MKKIAVIVAQRQNKAGVKAKMLLRVLREEPW